MDFNLQTYIPRALQTQVETYQQIFPVVALLGPRQCGKSTLALHLMQQEEEYVYLDLERPADLRKLNDPELFFRANADKLICLDKIQLRPDLFPVLRGIIDANRRNGRLFILGSASQTLLRQSAETLAGRIGYLELTPFFQAEIEHLPGYSQAQHWLRGGFPLSLAQANDHFSYLWRENFIRTFIERDILQLGLNLPAPRIRQLLSMLAHQQGQLLNSSQIGKALGFSHTSIRNYLDLMEQAFIIRRLPPLIPNLKKRLIKSPKIYLRDAGLLHALLEIETFNQLLGHPVLGNSWEGFVIENLLAALPDWQAAFYRTSSGNEIDLILRKRQHTVAIEIKANTAPKLGKGFYLSLDELQIQAAWLVAPVEESYPLNERVQVGNLAHVVEALRQQA